MDEIARRFAELADRYGPAVVDATLGAARMEAYSTLASSALWLLASGGAAFCARRWLRYSGDSIDEEFIHVIGWVAAVVAGLLVLPALWGWLDPWTWTALAHPELWVAKKVMKL